MADYLKSPVFSSPSYWIALGVGVVGIGAAAMQERKGSAAKVYDTPFDPSTMSDKPGSATPRQIAILMRMGALLPDGKDVHGKNMRVSKRQASDLIRSMVEMRRADKAGSSVAYNVYLRGKLIDTVFQSGMSTVEEVKRSLINHDGYDPAIRVTKARSSGSGSMADMHGSGGMHGSAAYRPYTSYGGDPYWMTAKYAGTDAKGLAFKKGERVFYYPKTKTIYAGTNAETAYHDFQSMAEYEEGY
jgi:hypothetical protein